MNSLWQSIIAIASHNSFAWTVLLVVCFACILAFIFEAAIEIVVTVVTLGCLTAIVEHVMLSRNDR